MSFSGTLILGLLPDCLWRNLQLKKLWLIKAPYHNRDYVPYTLKKVGVGIGLNQWPSAKKICGYSIELTNLVTVAFIHHGEKFAKKKEALGNYSNQRSLRNIWIPCFGLARSTENWTLTKLGGGVG